MTGLPRRFMGGYYEEAASEYHTRDDCPIGSEIPGEQAGRHRREATLYGMPRAGPLVTPINGTYSDGSDPSKRPGQSPAGRFAFTGLRAGL
jgi:hypothetical protein